MTGIAVVASAHDAKFAEEVRAGLQAAGFDASVSQSLPKSASPRVVLIWSAALEADHAIDAQALIGLWSEERLVIARRDETPLPLGLRDLPSLPPSSSAAEVCGAVPGVHHLAAGSLADIDQVSVGSMADVSSTADVGATGTRPTDSQEVEIEFWRAIKDGNDPDDFELYIQQFPTGIYAELSKRKIAKLRGTATDDAGAAELEKRELNEAGKREAEVKQKLADDKAKLEAQLSGKAGYEQREAGVTRATVPVGPIIAAIVATILVGGGAWYYFNKSSIEKQAALTAALETATKASQELQQAQAKQLESLKALEQARAAEDVARESGDVAKLKEAQEAAKRAEAEANKQADLVKQREAAAADARKKATEAAEHAKMARKAPEPMEERASVAKAEAPRKTEVAAAPKAEAKAPTAVASAPSAKGPDTDYETLYQHALAMEQDGKATEAIRIYRRAARAGSGKAAKRLGEIYDKGVPGVPRDYAESLQWYETARQLGERIEILGRRGGPETPAVAAPAPAPTPDLPKAAAPVPPPAPEPERKTEWFSLRGLLIALLVLGIIAWRRSRRREKALAKQAQRQPDEVMAAARSVYRPSTAAPQGDATLFVSYSHKDRSRVEPIVSVIEEMGRRVWMDRTDITGQTGWAGQIVRAIRECRAVVLMASPNSYTSDQVVRELYLAMNHRKTIVPIEIEPAEMPDELQYILAPFQHHRLSAGETRAVLGRALAAV